MLKTLQRDHICSCNCHRCRCSWNTNCGCCSGSNTLTFSAILILCSSWYPSSRNNQRKAIILSIFLHHNRKKICLSCNSNGSYCRYIRCPSGGGPGPGPNPPNLRCIENCERSFLGERNNDARIVCQQGYRGGTEFPT